MFNLNLGKKVGAAALVILGTMSSANALVLDAFDYAVGPIALDGVGDSYTEDFVGVTETSPASDVNYYAEVLSDTNGSSLTGIVGVEVSGGQLSYAEGPNVDGVLVLSYSDADAVAPIDFTDAGSSDTFYFDIVTAVEGFSVDLVVTTLTGIGSATLNVAAAVSNAQLNLDFADFVGVGVIDFANVVGVVATINSDAGSDLILSGVGTTNVPAPTTLAIFGLGLLGLGLSRRRQA